MAKKGKPDGWPEQLWQTYKQHGESDQKHVESCNRLLEALMTLYPTELAQLTHGLRELIEDQDQRPNPEDQLDVYRAWYAKHINWPTECYCGMKDWFVHPEGVPLGKPTKTFAKDAEEFVAPTQVHPWFLGACIQLARHLTKGGHEAVPKPRQGLLSQPKDYRAAETIQKYLTESGWALDQLWLEKAPDVWIPNDTRRPDESLKDFINRLVRSFGIFMSLQIEERAWARPDAKVEVQGRPLNPARAYERMCVRRMFGEKIPDIVEAEKTALLDKKGRFTRSPASAEREVRRRSNEAAKRLGIKLPAAKKTS